MDDFDPEVKIRDLYAECLSFQRPKERLLGTETTFQNSRFRSDMRTIDSEDIVREWEFKICAGYGALGQILTYVALSRCLASNGKTVIRGVLAAFDFEPEIVLANEQLNLGIEFLSLPRWMRRAGGVPEQLSLSVPLVQIPKLQRQSI